MSDLKPCPHCNGPAHIVIGDEFCHTRCSQCGATGGPADAIRESDAIAAWNRRPTEQQAAEIRRLTEKQTLFYMSPGDRAREERLFDRIHAAEARAEQAERERDEAREAAHYANGTAELAMKHRDTAEARVKELEEALDPFAAVAEHDIGEDEVDKDRFTPMVVNHRAPLITVGDLRRARAALKGEQFGAFGGEPRTDAMRRLLTEANARNGELRDALIDATAHLAAATSSYKRFCRKGVTGDALFSTKLSDYEKAEARARAALKGE